MKKKMNPDVVIVGAGLGGVLCGALLGREGYKVCILEKLAFPGGRYTSFDKNGFKVNTGAYAVGLHGKNGPLWKLLMDIGVEVEVRETPAHQVWVGEKRIQLPAKGQLKTVLEAVSKEGREAERVMNAVRKALRWQEPPDEITCQQWLYQYTDNRSIHGFFDFFSRSMTGTYYYNFPAGEYLRLMRSFGIAGTTTAMPKNGQRSTMDSLIGILRKSGVELFLETQVEKIICQNGTVEGVVANSAGDEIEIDAKVVISDVGPKLTVNLAGEENFETAYLNKVREINETRAVVNIFGYEEPILGSPHHIQLLDWDRLSAAWEANHVWPDYAPPGRQNMITYATMKTNDTEKELDFIMEQCKSQFPALEKAEVIATLVFQGDWPILRAKPSMCLTTKTPVYGLYISGDGVNPSGWTCGEGIAFTSPEIARDIMSRFPEKG
ncbi:MAG: NAD(P)/FAD-dependent oxidoreductase [Pseudomonadota bacterium]